MDSDEFDDDIADEDILAAFDQVSSSNGGQLASTSSSNGAKSNVRDLSNQQRAAQELNDLPSDAFSSPEPVRGNVRAPARPLVTARTGFSRTNSGTLRQTTLWGGQAATEDAPRPSQPTTTRVYRADLPP
ncbi:hypothetical protein TrVGV298_008924 [Trichoderma virens]|nr:hypothetical protein TrVGV298_008924 [Trichoderma virens]